jgi:hypothetical protein
MRSILAKDIQPGNTIVIAGCKYGVWSAGYKEFAAMEYGKGDFNTYCTKSPIPLSYNDAEKLCKKLCIAGWGGYDLSVIAMPTFDLIKGFVSDVQESEGTKEEQLIELTGSFTDSDGKVITSLSLKSDQKVVII